MKSKILASLYLIARLTVKLFCSRRSRPKKPSVLTFCRHRYDSEEDRILERIQNAQRARQIAKDASKQLDALHTYRQQKAATQKAAQSSTLTTPSDNEADFMYERGHHKKAMQDLAPLMKHEALWRALDDGYKDTESFPLTVHNIPWPPFDDYKRYITAMAEISTHDLRKAYAKACLRWHPDKFQHRLGRAIRAEDLPCIMEKVQDIAQGINRAWSDLKHL